MGKINEKKTQLIVGTLRELGVYSFYYFYDPENRNSNIFETSFLFLQANRPTKKIAHAEILVFITTPRDYPNFVRATRNKIILKTCQIIFYRQVFISVFVFE